MSASTEHGRVAMPRASGRPWEGIIYGVFVILAVVLASGYILYLFGRYDPALENRIPFGQLLFWLGNLAALYACIVVLLLLLVLQWRVASPALRASRVMVIASMGIGLVLAFSLRPGGIDRFADGFQDWVAEEADLQAIGAWEVEEQEEIPPSAWPDCVKVLRPRTVSSLGPGRGVRLQWGGGFMMPYGLVAGPTTMPIDPPGGIVRVRVMQPGAYVYFQDERPPRKRSP